MRSHRWVVCKLLLEEETTRLPGIKKRFVGAPSSHHPVCFLITLARAPVAL